MPAAGYVLEPRPTNNAVEDDDDCVQTPNAERQTLPQSFDLLQHSFGDFADLAWGQE
jgi:hypothetical protein